MNTNDLIRSLAAPLVKQAVTTLGDYLPITDVAQVELASAGQSAAAADVTVESELIERMRTSQALAVPLIGSAKGQTVAAGHDALPPAAVATPPAIDDTFLLIPASEAGKKYGEEAERVLPGVHLVNVPGQADLMFCREQKELTVEDLTASSGRAARPTRTPRARHSPRRMRGSISRTGRRWIR